MCFSRRSTDLANAIGGDANGGNRLRFRSLFEVARAPNHHGLFIPLFPPTELQSWRCDPMYSLR
jgi:hypothetical protein